MHLSETDEIAGELYLVPPDRFVAARDQLVRQARAAGHRKLARELHSLRRPTLSAWLVNLLARHERASMQGLFAVGRELRHAQTQLDATQLRHLAAQRQQLIADLLDRARRHAAEAGEPTTEAALSEVEATLHAGLVDLAAASTVMSGRLARPMSHAGFGPMPQVDRAGTPPPSVPDPGPAQDRRGEWSPHPADDELGRRREQADPAKSEHGAGQNAQQAPARAPFDGQQAQRDPAAARRQPPAAEESIRRAEADLAAATSAHWQREHDLADAEAAVEAIRDRLEWLDSQRMEIRREKVAAEQHLAEARSAQRTALRTVADARRALEAVEERFRRAAEHPPAHHQD